MLSSDVIAHIDGLSQTKAAMQNGVRGRFGRRRNGRISRRQGAKVVLSSREPADEVFRGEMVRIAVAIFVGRASACRAKDSSNGLIAALSATIC